MLNEIREEAERSLESFIKLVAPERVLGLCHKEVLAWWDREDSKSHQLLLFPRDHMKSALVAYRVAHALAKDPTLRILYISSTANLAEKQLGFIKNILTSKIFRTYWPEHTYVDEGKREKWTNTEIALDHPLRKAENIRDPSVFTGGLTTNLVGMHCDIAVLDDLVTGENAYTEEGRRKVQRQYSLLSSIEGANAKEWVVGTRYHPRDLYHDMLEMAWDKFDKDGNCTGTYSVFEVLQREVEDSYAGDGSGEFLWPRQMRKDGKWFGFSREILAQKRAKYLDRMQFRAQYYNDPSDPDNAPVKNFSYYAKNKVRQSQGDWYYEHRKLNIIASVDFAFSKRKTADYTAIVVVGVDEDNNYYVLDIDRFKADSITEYFQHIFTLYNRWEFKTLVCEATAGQSAIVKTLKEDHFRPARVYIRVEEVKPTRHEGTKEERIDAILTPLYENGQVQHYRGGNCQILEEELSSYTPPTDDIKDALANAVDKAKKPSRSKTHKTEDNKVTYHPRFGGRSF